MARLRLWNLIVLAFQYAKAQERSSFRTYALASGQGIYNSGSLGEQRHSYGWGDGCQHISSMTFVNWLSALSTIVGNGTKFLTLVGNGIKFLTSANDKNLIP